MGMSASQARFLCLTARKNNVEFEGQQINQQRTTLSNESASYYSELCNMEVPVPPSIDDYTKVTYSFNDGAMTNTVTSLLFSSSEGKYHLNYLQQWQDDYAIVPASSALVQKTGSSYSIGGTELRQMEATAPTTVPSSVANDPYYKSLANDEERLKALQTEQYYVALLREELNNDSAEFYVRYAQNSATGAYEPYFYLKSQLEDSSLYTDRNLASVTCYSVGSAVKTKEVLNQTLAAVEQDASGRYISFTYEATTGTVEVPKNNQAEINAWKAAHPAPKPEDYTTIGVVGGHYESNTDDGLALKFSNAVSGCYKNATNPSSSLKTGCYKHVLAYLLNLHTDGYGVPDASYYPQTFNTSIGSTITIDTGAMSGSAISVNHSKVEDLVEISGYVTNGKDGETLMSGSVDNYSDLGLSSAVIDSLSDKYIKTGRATDAQKLLSNYYKDSSGNIVNKSIMQKAIDLYYVCSNLDTLGLDYDTQVMPIIQTFQYDMTHIEQIWVDDYGEVEDTPSWQAAYSIWEASIPKLETWTEQETVTIPGKRYYLNTSTVTDEEAYNDAMNDYYYQQHEYDHKIQEINAKLEIIQQQDKQLELKLKQLDTEENAISTEMDAVKKVISKNIDNSFKTFSA